MPYDATESLAGGVVPLQMSSNSLDIVKNDCSSSARRSTHIHRTPSIKLVRYEGTLSGSHPFPHDPTMKIAYSTTPPRHASMIISKHSFRTSHFIADNTRLDGEKDQLRITSNGDCQVMEDTSQCNGCHTQKPAVDAADCSSGVCSEFSNSASLLDDGEVDLLNAQIRSKSGTSCCPSPEASFYTTTRYTEANQSFTNSEVSECPSSMWKTGASGEISNSCDFTESRSTDIYRGTSGSDLSPKSRSNSFSSPIYRRHGVDDKRWEAVQTVRLRNNGALELKNFRILKRLGNGDIGTVHLAELIGTGIFFAMKVMDKDTLVSRKKIIRAQTEREILQSLDHPFLPTLYAHFETDRRSLLVMEFCPGGDLYSLRQKQPGKFFPEHAARFYLAEVLLALEYLHMLGIVYRDLKPENILVREDGHIMLSDFDLSLRCVVHPTLVKSSNPNVVGKKNSRYCIYPACLVPCTVHTSCIRSTCFSSRHLGNPKKERKSRPKIETQSDVHTTPLPELIVEPTGARSMSFVGTHEYLAPEIIKGEGHGSAVDWWTFGIFLYELLFGTTPFRGAGNRATLFNVVWQPLRFPETPTVSFAARDLIRGLLVKEPQHRLAYRRGATEIKQHPFFQSVNWALIRCARPPAVPSPFTIEDAEAAAVVGEGERSGNSYLDVF